MPTLPRRNPGRQAPTSGAKAGDIHQLQGSWKVTSLETDGQRVSRSMFGDARIVISGERFTSLGMGATYEGIVELHRAGKHKAVDLVFTAGHAEGTRNRGIYKIDGNTWMLCLSTQSDKRPASFATKPESGLVLEVLKREKENAARGGPELVEGTHDTENTFRLKADTTAIEVPAAPATELEGEWAMVSAVFDGKPMADDMVAWCKRITRGNITTVTAGPQTMMKATFTVDGSITPATIDYVNLHGGSKGKAQAGIYELTGEALKICMAPPGQRRPKTFASLPKDGRSYTTWRKSAP